MKRVAAWLAEEWSGITNLHYLMLLALCLVFGVIFWNGW